MTIKPIAYRDIELGRISVLPSGKRRIELRFSCTDGGPGHVLMDMGDISELRTLQRRLRNAGYGGMRLTRADALALDALIIRFSKSALGRAAVVPIRLSGGWNKDRSSFTLDDHEIPSGRLIFRSEHCGKAVNARRGSINGWKSTVGAHAWYSSRTMLLISAAFAASSLAYTNIEAGGFGFNIWGPSSTGKSTALRAAASVLSSNFAGTWNGTVCGLQDLAQKYCDLPLTVDSMESISGEAQKEVTDAVAYALGSGMARVRVRTHGVGHSADIDPWRTILLSTAEARAQRIQKSGAAVRFIDIPVAADLNNPLGIIDYFPPRMAKEDRQKFAIATTKLIQRGAARQHGYLLPAYIEELARQPKTAYDRLAVFHAKFIDTFKIAEMSNTERRILEHFAVVFSAGRLAIQLGLLPWEEAHYLDAIRRCATDALDNNSDCGARNAKNADRVREWVANPQRTSMSFAPSLTRKDISSVDILTAGFASDDMGEGVANVSLVLRPVLQKELGLTIKELAGAMTKLKQSGFLITEARDDVLTMQQKFKDCSARFYVVRNKG